MQCSSIRDFRRFAAVGHKLCDWDEDCDRDKVKTNILHHVYGSISPTTSFVSQRTINQTYNL